jgi:hypothetical protein
MAPPVRTYGSAPSQAAENDPLASLMAPPPVRIPSQNSFVSGPPGAPPVRRAAAAPPTKVWTPPVNIMKPNQPNSSPSGFADTQPSGHETAGAANMPPPQDQQPFPSSFPPPSGGEFDFSSNYQTSPPPSNAQYNYQSQQQQQQSDLPPPPL